MDRVILHCDCNGFYASVECAQNPALRTVPMAVAGDPKSRHGIILAKNELAKQFHVQTAETIFQAQRKCPNLVLVPPRHDLYEQYSLRINEIYARFTDLVEPFGIDESWLDVTGSRALFGDGVTIADRLRQTVRAETGLTISVGVSFNKIFAKLGSDYRKPDATTLFSRDNYRDLVFPLPVSSLLFVGSVTKQALYALGIRTIGDLAAYDRDTLVRVLGKSGEMLSRYARGEDDAPVRRQDEGEPAKSVGNGMTFAHDLITEEEIAHGLRLLSDSVAARMRRMGVMCETLQVTIKTPEFKVISRQRRLERPTDLTRELGDAAIQIVRQAWTRGAPIRALTVTAQTLVPRAEAAEQLTLFEQVQSREKVTKLEHTMDSLREKYGSDSVSYGTLVEPNPKQKKGTQS